MGSEDNVIRGIHFANFSGPGIAISGEARTNVIGGDRDVGAGPLGEGNLFTHSGVGVDLSTSGTSLNVVTGNLIGTDATGTAALGDQTGVWISGGAHNNTIGPDNVIAHNGGYGIVVQDPDTLHNTLTRNSLHDNGARGIGLWDGGNAELAEPLVLDFDLHAGTLMGITCPNCTVEITSDDDDEGAVYEGSTVADGTGVFSFAKGSAFTGPNVTATATDPGGNTSEFSVPTSISSRALVVQRGNSLPISPFRAQCSSALLDNHLGTFWGYLASPEMDGDFACNPQGVKGLKMVRFSFNEVEDWPSIDWTRPELSISTEQDAFVTGLADSGITITYILTFWDKANHPEGWSGLESRFTTEEEIQRYLTYVRFIVGHFKDRVAYYELWNEPDAGSPIQHIRPLDYVALVHRVVPVIRDEFPEARIVIGGVILREPYGQYYLAQLVQSDVMPLVDGVSWHPLYGTSPDYEDERDYYYAYPGILQLIMATATAHGFQGEFRGDEIGWCSPDSGDCGAAAHMQTNTAAAKYLGRGIIMHLGRDVAVHIGGVSGRRRENSAMASNLATVFAGARAASFPVQAQTTVTNVVSYTFALSGEDRLVALWTDGVATDDDRGITTTLVLPGIVDRKVTAIDALYSYQQQIVTATVGGNLVIRDLLVKDYPLILRLSSTRYVFLPIVVRE